MPDESKRRYLFLAIDRATRRVYLKIKGHRDARSAMVFPKGLAREGIEHRFDPLADLDTALKRYSDLYNHHIPQRDGSTNAGSDHEGLTGESPSAIRQGR